MLERWLWGATIAVVLVLASHGLRCVLRDEFWDLFRLALWRRKCAPAVHAAGGRLPHTPPLRAKARAASMRGL